MICLRLRAADAVGDGEEIQKLPDLHAVVDAEVVGHVTDRLPDRDRVAGDAVSGDDFRRHASV